MPEAKPQLHQSQLDMLAKCGVMYKRRYIDGEIVPPGVALLVGTATHRSVELNLRHKARTGELLPTEEIIDSVRDDFTNRWDQEGVRLDSDEVLRGANAVKGSAIDLSIALATLHATDVAPNIIPISEKHVERKFVIELPGYPVDLAGKIDVQEARGPRDTKTVSKTPSQVDVDCSMQLSMYAAAVHVLDDQPFPIQVTVDSLVKTKTPKAVSLTAQRDEADVGRVLRRVERAVEIIESGQFTPAQADGPSAWVCSKRWCGYAETCPFWSGRP